MVNIMTISEKRKFIETVNISLEGSTYNQRLALYNATYPIAFIDSDLAFINPQYTDHSFTDQILYYSYIYSEFRMKELQSNITCISITEALAILTYSKPKW
jgi:hypothetical protein